MKCLLVYLDTEREFTQSRIQTLGDFLHCCMSIVVICPFKSYYGLQNITTLLLWYNKLLMDNHISTSTFLPHIFHEMLPKLQTLYGWILNLSDLTLNQTIQINKRLVDINDF